MKSKLISKPKTKLKKKPTKAVKINISVKISQGTHKIKEYKTWHHMPKTWEGEEQIIGSKLSNHQPNIDAICRCYIQL